MLDRTAAPPVKKISKIDFQKAEHTLLPNGIPLHIINAGAHDIVSIEIILKSGKWFEPENGISYFTSQMLLEGTSRNNSIEIAEIFEFNGAHVNIAAGIDFTSIRIYAVNTKLVEVLKIVRDCILTPTFPEDELQVMKDIQKQQLRINESKNSYVAGREIRKLLFGEIHPYGRLLSIHDIEDNINVVNLRNYYEKGLLNQIEVIISGNINKNILKSLDVLSDLPKNEFPGMGHPEISIHKKQVSVERPDSLQSSIRIGRKIIPKSHPDYIGLLILNEIFGGFFGSRLMANIREDKGYTYGIHSSIVSLLHNDYLVVGTDVKKEFAENTLEEIYKEAQRLIDTSISQDELGLVKNHLLGNFLSSLETSFSLADKFKNIYFFGMGYDFYDQYIDTIHSIKVSELQELANTYLQPSSFCQVRVG